jgi:hypothetical protein
MGSATSQNVMTQEKPALVRPELEPARVVVPEPPAPLRLVPDKATVTAGTEQPYKAVRDDQYGYEEDVTAQTNFTIDEPGTCTKAGAEVSCTASEPGTYTVKGTLHQDGQDDVTDEAVLHVEPVVASLKLKPESAGIVLGGTQGYTVEGFTADGHPVELDQLTAKPVLSVTQRRQPSGDCKETTCTPAKLGEHTVTATLTQQDQAPVTTTAVLHVEPVVERLELEPKSATIVLGQSQDYTVEGFAANNSPVDMDQLTAKPVLQPDQGGTCRGFSCTASEVGDYTVTATLD